VSARSVVAPMPAGRRGARVRGTASGLVAGARPRQWIKNVLVFLAPAAAGVLTQEAVLLRVIPAFVAFCLLASGTYLINDAADSEADRRHPTKRLRPVAAGRISKRTAVVAGVVLLVAGLGISAAVSTALLGVAIAYVALTASYTLWLKHIAFVDIVAVAGCHVLRALAGGAAAGVAISSWFLIVVSFASLLVAAGKRHAELTDGGPRISTRATLAVYSPGFLRRVWMIAAGIAIAAYVIWAAGARGDDAALWAYLSMLPFCAGIARYTTLLDSGAGETPEATLVQDRVMVLTLGAWAVLFIASVTVGG